MVVLSIAIGKDIGGCVDADLGEITDEVKEEVDVDADFDEVRGVIGVFPVSHFLTKALIEERNIHKHLDSRDSLCLPSSPQLSVR